MSFAKWKGRILTLHRWIALAISPVLLIVVLSGAVLAWKPILGARAAPKSDGRVDAPALALLLTSIDPSGSTRGLLVSEDGKTVELRGAGKGKPGLGTFDIATRARVSPASKFDVFDFAVKAHRGLFIGVHLLGDIASYALVAILILGPFIAWPRRRNTLMGFHVGAGWFLFPLLATGPVTAVLLALHIGSGSPGGAPREGGNPRGKGAEAAEEASIARALDVAREENIDLRTLRAAAQKGRGQVILSVASADGLVYHAVSTTARTVTQVRPAQSLVKQLHEGTWAGALSGGASLLGTVVLSGLIGSGVFAWARRSMRRRQSKAKRREAVAETQAP